MCLKLKLNLIFVIDCLQKLSLWSNKAGNYIYNIEELENEASMNKDKILLG